MFARSHLFIGQWLSLIEARRELIKPHLDSFTLSELGSFEWLMAESRFGHSLRLDVPTLTGDERFSLKTQGIFSLQSYVERIPDKDHHPAFGPIRCSNGIKRAWGLTRSGLWALVTISFADEAGYKGRGYERAKTVDIVEIDLSTIFTETKVKPEQMWRDLGVAVKKFTQHREMLYNQARSLALMIEVEETMLRFVPSEA